MTNGTTDTGYTLYDDVETNNNNNNIVLQVPTHPENDTNTETTNSSTILVPMSLQQPNADASNTCSTSAADNSTDEITTTEGKGYYLQHLHHLHQKICVYLRDVRSKPIYLNILATYAGIYYLCAYTQDNQVVYEQILSHDMNISFNIFNLLIKYENVLYDCFIITMFVVYIGIIVVGGIYGIAYNSKYLVAYIHYDIHTENCLPLLLRYVGIFKFFDSTPILLLMFFYCL